MSNDKYNGWTNYATWRVNLELFDGCDWNMFYVGSSPEPGDLGLELKEYAEGYIEQCSPEGLARDYAFAFISDVNWFEIAEHLLENSVKPEL